MEVKKVESLFHGTEKLEYLISILQEGFYPSYSTEKLVGKNIKVLMVSFSNIPLIEARHQVNYGDYFIGLKRDWGIRKLLHPVAYTYENSKYENDIYKLLVESGIGQTFKLLQQLRKQNIPVEFDEDLKTFGKLNELDLPEETYQTLNAFFKSIYQKIYDMALYLKHYVSIDKKGIQRYSYNDREWRYIPPDIEEKIIFQADVSGKYADRYKLWDSTKKPHFKINSLQFDLEDLNYIIVKEAKEIKMIFSILNSKFGEAKVMENLSNGNFSVLSIDKIWSNL